MAFFSGWAYKGQRWYRVRGFQPEAFLLGLPGVRDDGEVDAPALKHAKLHELAAKARDELEGEAQAGGAGGPSGSKPEERADERKVMTPDSDDEEEGKVMTPGQIKVMQLMLRVQQRALTSAGKAGKGSQASTAGVADTGAVKDAGKGSMSAPEPQYKAATANKISYVAARAPAPTEWPLEVLAHEDVPCFYCKSALATRKLMRIRKSSPRYIGTCFTCMEWAIKQNIFEELGSEHYTEIWDFKLLQQREQASA